MNLENHCGIRNCTCNHTYCVKGWLENKDRPDRKWWKKVTKTNSKGSIDYWYEYVKPCGVCRPELYEILSIADPVERQKAYEARTLDLAAKRAVEESERRKQMRNEWTSN